MEDREARRPWHQAADHNGYSRVRGADATMKTRKVIRRRRRRRGQPSHVATPGVCLVWPQAPPAPPLNSLSPSTTNPT